MSDDFDKGRVLDRVRKLLATAKDKGATANERETAMRMAHATLAKYGLMMADAEARGEKTEGGQRIDSTFSGRNYSWCRNLCNAVAKLFFCEYIFFKVTNDKADNLFIGREANVITSVEMCKYLIESIKREATTNQKALGENGTYWRSFCKGATYVIMARAIKLREAAEAAERPTSTGTSLVLADLYTQELAANAEFIGKHHPGTRVSTYTERNTNLRGAADGAAYGKRVSLNKQIAEDQKKALQ